VLPRTRLITSPCLLKPQQVSATPALLCLPNGRAPLALQSGRTTAYSYNSGCCENTKGHSPFDGKVKEFLPVGKQDNNVLSWRIGDFLPFLSGQPLQCPAEGASTTPPNQQPLGSHQRLHSSERFFIRGLDPCIDMRRITREHIRDEVVTDSLDDILSTFVCSI